MQLVRDGNWAWYPKYLGGKVHTFYHIICHFNFPNPNFSIFPQKYVILKMLIFSMHVPDKPYQCFKSSLTLYSSCHYGISI